jgi:cytochrome oxidase assembly protein ShyY1
MFYKALKNFFSLIGILKTLVTVMLIILCMSAASWQWHKGAALANKNGIITENVSQPAIPLRSDTPIDPNKLQWQKIYTTQEVGNILRQGQQGLFLLLMQVSLIGLQQVPGQLL